MGQYSIIFDQHKGFYDFYDEKIVELLNSIYERFDPGKDLRSKDMLKL